MSLTESKEGPFRIGRPDLRNRGLPRGYKSGAWVSQTITARLTIRRVR